MSERLRYAAGDEEICMDQRKVMRYALFLMTLTIVVLVGLGWISWQLYVLDQQARYPEVHVNIDQGGNVISLRVNGKDWTDLLDAAIEEERRRMAESD